jgi:SAM-dependent methyltransferase
MLNDRSQSAAALDVRADLNTSRGTFDLAAMAAVRLDLTPDSLLLDLGSGTGTLLVSYASRIQPPGECVAIDISAESLGRLRQRAVECGLPVRTYRMNMDELIDSSAHPELRGFSHISAVYSFYYSADPARLLDAAASRLTADGRVVVVAPTPGNNVEWFALLDEASVRVPRWIRNLDRDFIRKVLEPNARRLFARVDAESATNVVTFRSAEELNAYWRSNIYFSPEASPRVEMAIARRFDAGSEFHITKRLKAVRMERPR